jgi:hypothetical protein
MSTTVKKKVTNSNHSTDLIEVVELQQNTIRNQQHTIAKLVKELKKVGSYYDNKMVEKSGKITSSAKAKKKTHYDFLIKALKKIGSPCTTDQIASGLKKENPKFRAMATNNYKGFMQFIYSAVSHLSEKGILNKKSVNAKAYEYSLPEWNEN